MTVNINRKMITSYIHLSKPVRLSTWKGRKILLGVVVFCVSVSVSWCICFLSEASLMFLERETEKEWGYCVYTEQR